MCGFIGFLSADGKAKALETQVRDALLCQYHRGPDDADTFADDDITFGFNRLSIIDIANSRQPLVWGPEDNPQRYLMMFNGEIYNYVELREELIAEFGATFHTKGDGEPIVVGFHHVGPAIVERLRGMFAIAIWDTVDRRLFIARDPFGIKPLFMATTDAGTVFSSEKKSIVELAEPLGIDLELNDRHLQHYLTMQYVPEPETLQNGITRLESGSYALVKPGEQVRQVRYFDPKFPLVPVKKDEQEALYDRIAEALVDSVEKHMRADVTVGSFLSGGIDSTAIAALAKRYNPNLLTFTVGFERHGFSEIDVAAESAAAIGVEHIVKVIQPDEFVDVLPKIMWYLDEPVADPALIPLYFVAAEARKRVKVVLSGEGADELFGGYQVYREPIALRAFEPLPWPMRRALGRLGDRLPQIKGKSFLQRGALSLEERYYGNARNFTYPQIERIYKHARPEWGHRDVTDPIWAMSKGLDPVTRMQHLDLFTWMRGDILVKADKINMAHSLELRVPFLDREVFKVAETVPVDQRIAHGTTKYALRQALKRIVPAHVLNRPKLGFPVPTRHWMAGDELYPYVHKVITESETDHLFNKRELLAMLDEHRRGDSDHARRLWTVLCFMLWHGIFVEERIDPQIERREYPVEL